MTTVTQLHPFWPHKYLFGSRLDPDPESQNKREREGAGVTFCSYKKRERIARQQELRTVIFCMRDSEAYTPALVIHSSMKDCRAYLLT